jgi:membrane protein
LGQLRALPARELGAEFVRKFRADDVLGLAAEVAYHLIFAIPPLLILTMTGAAALNRFTSVPVEEELRTLVDERAPVSLQEVFDTVITTAVSQASGGVISAGLLVTTIVAIWSGSNGIAAIMKAYNRAYDVEEDRPYLRKRVVAVGLTVLLVVLINAVFALVVFGETLGMWVANWLGMGSQFRTLWEVGRWPGAIGLFMFLLAVLYYLAPAIEQSFRWISPGSVIATILWIAAVFGFRFYLSFASTSSTYGAFSSLIVVLFFLYITSVVLLIGAEINAILQKRYDTVVVRDRVEHPERLTSDSARHEARTEARELDHREARSSE